MHPDASPGAVAPAANGHDAHHGSGNFWLLSLGSVGVVFGDIGTSPLYALQACLSHVGDGGPTPAEVIGVVSLIVWALIVTVTVKYVLFLMRADNKGEGGILSLMALAQSALGKRTLLIFFLGVAGSALFSGDAVITPAISVLSALEGLKQISPKLAAFILPATIVILILLFLVQSRGTAGMAAFFGPIMVVFFFTIAILGATHIHEAWNILGALSPFRGVVFLYSHGAIGFVVLGSVFLAVTGGEALYADMGHFGRAPIQASWIFLVLPALILNYLGQGANIIADSKSVENPYYLMAPAWGLMPLIILSTVATVIASQAVITGAFSLARQAIQLGLLPRLEIVHTSDTLEGQLFIPRVNRILLFGVLALVLMFRSSDALANAYGIAVSGTMVATTALAAVGGAGAGLRVPVDRRQLPRRQSLQGSRRRLGALAARRHDVYADVDLGARQRDPQREDASRFDPDARTHQDACQIQARAGAGDRDFSHQRPAIGALVVHA
jgi:KUP system potassium uptake protein